MNENLKEKITFRKHDQSDIENRVKWLNDFEISKYVGDQCNTTVIKQREWFLKYLIDDTRDFFTICADKKSIGIVGLSNIDLMKSEAKLFIMIGEKNYQGKGLGKQSVKYIVDYGFHKLGLRRIISEVFEENIPAINCYKSAGFQIDDKIDSMLIMSICI